MSWENERYQWNGRGRPQCQGKSVDTNANKVWITWESVEIVKGKCENYLTHLHTRFTAKTNKLIFLTISSRTARFRLKSFAIVRN